MIDNLLLATVMVCATVLIHFLGLLLLSRLLRHGAPRFNAHDSIPGQAGLILFVVLGIFAIHSVEIWLYAVIFRVIDALPDFEEALYFSTVTFSSLGYGDLTLTSRWRLFGAIEAVNGLILIAWSAAFLLSVTGRLRTLEHEWREGGDETARPASSGRLGSARQQP